jgi:hypothetical protein
MTLFILGFICFWVVFAVLQLIVEKHDLFYKNWYQVLTTAPISLPLAIVLLLCMSIYRRWRNVIHSVPTTIFNAEMQRGNLKVLHIGRFKVCYDTNAKPINRLYFVRVEK